MQTGCKWAARTSLLALFLIAQQSLADLAPPGQWQATLYGDHPLVGRIYDVHAERFLGAAELQQRLLDAGVIMLGEKHDNPDHHSLQLAVLEMLSERALLGQLTMEMLDDQQQALVDALKEEARQDADVLKESLQWDEQGWAWPFYGPLLGHALDRDVPVRSGNISNERMREIYADEQLEVASTLGEQALERLLRDIDESHCGMLPESQFPAMLRVQQARDRAMAAGLASGEVSGKRVLIAGNYHARRDLGVLNYLPDELAAQTLSLSLLEVNPESERAQDYVDATAGQPAHDVLWFTPALSNEDYCASMRAN